jgi:hypothetical protein
VHPIETDLGATPAPTQGPGLSRKDDDEDDQGFVIVDNLRNGKKPVDLDSAGNN